MNLFFDSVVPEFTEHGPYKNIFAVFCGTTKTEVIFSILYSTCSLILCKLRHAEREKWKECCIKNISFYYTFSKSLCKLMI